MANLDETKIHLSDEEGRINVKSNTETLEILLHDIKKIFISQNKWIVYSLAVIWVAEIIMISAGLIDPAERIFTEKVLITLVGATIVQVGTIIAAIAIGRRSSKS